jgi:AcrR family transcriptional regulator
VSVVKKPRSRYHHGSLRDSALEAALREIDAHGHEGFSLERVAKSLGVTAAALYRHYDNREALLTATVFQGFVQFVARVDAAALAENQPAAVLRAVGRAFVGFAMEHPGWFRLQFSRAGAALPVKHEDVDVKYAALLQAALAHYLGDDQAAVDRWYLFNWTVIHGAASHAIEHALPWMTTDAQRMEHVEMLLDTLIEALERARPAEPAPPALRRAQVSRDAAEARRKR